EAARRIVHRGEPRPHRRGHDARRDRRGLPRVQREQRPAVRAHVRPPRDGAQRAEPRARQRGAHRRHARRRRQRDHAEEAPRRHDLRDARPQARDDRQAASDRLDDPRPPALGARPEVRRDHEGPGPRRLRGRRHDPACARHARAGRDRRVLLHVRRADARRVAHEPQRVRRRARRPRALAQRRARRAARSAAQPPAGGREPLGPADRSRGLLPGPRTGGGRGRSGRRGAGQPLPQPRHDVRRARRRGAAAAGHDLHRPGGAPGRHRGLPRPASVPAQQRGPLPRAAARDPGDPQRGARPVVGVRARPRVAAALGRAQPRAVADVPRDPGVRRGSHVLARPERPAQRHRHPAADHARPRARPDGVQLPDPLVPQRRLAPVRGRRPGHVAALHHHRGALGPEQRGRPLQRPRERSRHGSASGGRAGARRRRHRGQLPASEPVPEHAGRGTHERVRVRQRALAQGPQGPRQRPGQPGPQHREDEDHPRQRGQPAVAGAAPGLRGRRGL
ncbi:MAG: hypothetical protein AVDCRST_MAG85-3115, partial [uncultured Solirubrobacteraceae bacterium]